MADIYNISNWAASTSYNVNDIVINGSYYYYSLTNHTSSSNFSSDLTNNWGGVLSYQGRTLPQFFWKISYGYTLDIEPAIKSIKFGDNYEQILADGIQNILLPFNIDFNNRDSNENRAISHFLFTRAGHGKFYFTPPQPYNIPKIFTCPKWSSSQEFYNNYTIKANFTEKVI